jgi:hypothetical protein
MGDVTELDSPIDVMYLMHNAFQAVSARTEQLAAEGESGKDLRAFRESFDLWIKQLLFHATAEDKYMTANLVDSQPARDNEAEHAELVQHGGDLIEYMDKGDAAGLAENVKTAMLALEEEQHRELVEKVQEVEELLKQEIGEERVVARTRRHLYRRVMALRILEFDHFENEEAFVLPIVRERMNAEQELELARRLLIDEEAEDPRWVIDWVASELAPGERGLLDELDARLAASTA